MLSCYWFLRVYCFCWGDHYYFLGVLLIALDEGDLDFKMKFSSHWVMNKFFRIWVEATIFETKRHVHKGEIRYLRVISYDGTHSGPKNRRIKLSRPNKIYRGTFKRLIGYSCILLGHHGTVLCTQHLRLNVNFETHFLIMGYRTILWVCCFVSAPLVENVAFMNGSRLKFNPRE